MNKYLVDETLLAEYANAILAEKMKVHPMGDLTAEREKIAEELDDRIGKAIFGGLTNRQLDEVNALLDRDDDPEAYQKFFENAGIDVAQKATDVLNAYMAEYIGGENV